MITPNKIQTLIESQDRLLQQNEYFGRALIRPVEREWFRKTLNLHLTRILSTTEPKTTKSEFFINTSSLFNHGTERVDFKFHYLYDHGIQDLRIRGVQSKLEEITRYDLMTSNSQLKKASAVYDLMSKERKIKSARRIVPAAASAGLNLFKSSGWLIR